MDRPHRKRIKHFQEPGHLHELTFSCYQRLPLLTSSSRLEMLSASVQRAVVHHRYGLIAFVFMPEHVHLLVLPQREASSIPALLNAIKRPCSYRIKQLLMDSKSDLLEKLTVHQRPGVTTFRFWQEGPGFDRNITEAKTIEDAINYFHNNPVKRGLCERATDWKWSSARSFLLPETPLDPALPPLTKLPPEYLA